MCCKISVFKTEENYLKKSTLRNIAEIEGKVFNSNSFGKFTVTSYEHNTKVHILFEDTGGVNTTSVHRVRTGEVVDLLAKTNYGAGYIGYGYDYKCKDSRKLFKVWNGVLQRCFDPLWKGRHTCYEQTTCSEIFLCASDFIGWSKSQIGYNSVDEFGKPFALDKDILSKGNTDYSPDTCVFVPREVNNLILSNKKLRGVLPIGVTTHRSKFRARVSINNQETALGVFDTKEEAFYAYKQVKEAYIKQVANKWRDQIDPRTYEALLNWEVEITD